MAPQHVELISRAFAAQRLPVVARGAHDGDWLALLRGWKPAVREVIPASALPALRAFCAGHALEVHVAPLHSEFDASTGVLRCIAAPGSEDPPAGEERLLAVVSGEPSRALRIVELDAALARPGRDGHEASLVYEHGVLLGYPPCCVEAYASQRKVHHNAQAISASASRSQRFHPLLNNLSQGVFHLYGWIPCRYDCPATVSHVLRVYAELDARERAQFLQAAALTRVYVDERRQLLLQGGAPSPGQLGFKRLFTPRALDPRPEHAGDDWRFFAEVAWPLSAGHALAVRGAELHALRGATLRAVIDVGSAPVVLPFGAF